MISEEELDILERYADDLDGEKVRLLVAEVRRLRFEVEMWKRQRAADNNRWEQRWQRQVDYTNVWHGRYEVLRHENNKFRKKMLR